MVLMQYVYLGGVTPSMRHKVPLLSGSTELCNVVLSENVLVRFFAFEISSATLLVSLSTAIDTERKYFKLPENFGAPSHFCSLLDGEYVDFQLKRSQRCCEASSCMFQLHKLDQLQFHCIPVLSQMQCKGTLLL